MLEKSLTVARTQIPVKILRKKDLLDFITDLLVQTVRCAYATISPKQA